MASLFKAISNWFRGKKDAAAQSMADPVRDGKFAIEDSRKAVAEYRTKVGQAMAATKQLEQEIKSAQEDVEKYTRIAASAAKANSENDVREAVTQKQRASTRVEQLSKDVEKNRAVTDNLRQHLRRAETKIADAENNHAILAARHESAKARQALASAHTQFANGDNPLAALDDLERVVNQSEAEAEAFEEVSGLDANGATLEEKYSTSGGSVDDEVAALMGKSKGNTTPVS